MTTSRMTTLDRTDDALVPITAARRMLGAPGRPLAKQTVTVLAGLGELELRRVAGRLVVTQRSITSYLKRRDAQPPPAA